MWTLFFLFLVIFEALAEHPVGEAKWANENLDFNVESQNEFEILKFLNISQHKENWRNLFPNEYFTASELHIQYVEELAKLPSMWKGMYLPFHSKSKKCKKGLMNLYNQKNLAFTLRLIDSWGKFPDGILWGNINPVGMYEECLQLNYDSSVNNEMDILKGRYCSISVSVVGPKAAASQTLALNVDPRMANTYVRASATTTFSYGTCIPSECTQADMEEHLAAVLPPPTQTQNGKVATAFCYSMDDPKEPFTAGDISFLVFVAIICCVILVATIVDIYAERVGNLTLKEGHFRKLLAFSLQANIKKLFDITVTPKEDSITCIHGIRVFSMIWVIYGHQTIITVPAAMNIVDIPRKTRDLLFQIVSNGTFSVDTFFFISGLVVAYLGFKQMEKNRGRLNLIYFYVHRYIRLTPAIAVTAWFTATVSRYLVHGPYTQLYTPIIKACQKSWWASVLYVNNYAVDSPCILQAWYTATDTQIYIFMPLVLLPLYNWREWGKVWLAFLTALSCTICGTICAFFDVNRIFISNKSETQMNIYWDYVYQAPFSRAGPYLVGMAVGYFLQKYKRKHVRLNEWQVILGWILSTALALILLFGIWNYNVIYLLPQNWDKKKQMTTAVEFFYEGFSRTIWALCLSWLVIACHYGYGGPVNRFLSHPSLQPLSRLTYPMFLLSLSLQVMIVSNAMQPFYFSHLNKIIETCGSLFIIGIAAVLLSLLIESPIIGLEKELFRVKAVSSQPITEQTSKQAAKQETAFDSNIFPSSSFQDVEKHEKSEYSQISSLSYPARLDGVSVDEDELQKRYKIWT